MSMPSMRRVELAGVRNDRARAAVYGPSVLGVGNVDLLVTSSNGLQPSSFLLLLVRHWLLEAMHLLLLASC